MTDIDEVKEAMSALVVAYYEFIGEKCTVARKIETIYGGSKRSGEIRYKKLVRKYLFCYHCRTWPKQYNTTDDGCSNIIIDSELRKVCWHHIAVKRRPVGGL